MPLANVLSTMPACCLTCRPACCHLMPLSLCRLAFQRLVYAIGDRCAFLTSLCESHVLLREEDKPEDDATHESTNMGGQRDAWGDKPVHEVNEQNTDP